MPHVKITLIAIIVTSVLFSGKGNGIEMRASLFLGDEPNFLLSFFCLFTCLNRFICCRQWAVIYSNQYPHETDSLPAAMLQAQTEHSQAELGCKEALLFTASMSAVLFSVNSQAFSSIFRSLFSFNKIMYLANRHHSVLFAKVRKPRENTSCWESHRCWFCALVVNVPSSCSQHKGYAVPSTAGSVCSWMHRVLLSWHCSLAEEYLPKPGEHAREVEWHLQSLSLEVSCLSSPLPVFPSPFLSFPSSPSLSLPCPPLSSFSPSPLHCWVSAGKSEKKGANKIKVMVICVCWGALFNRSGCRGR